MKPKLKEWDNPDVIWPPIMTRPTKLTKKALLRQLEDEEKERLMAMKNFNVTDVMSGDIVEYIDKISLSSFII